MKVLKIKKHIRSEQMNNTDLLDKYSTDAWITIQHYQIDEMMCVFKMKDNEGILLPN